MTDNITAAQRSKLMRGVRRKDTSLEMLVRKQLHKLGLRYRLGGCGLPGRPDLVFPRLKSVVFVHGCFWHAHDCRLGKRPASNMEFWAQKALLNKERDVRKEAELRALGWRVFLIWQCELKGDARADRLNRLAQDLKSGWR